MTDSSPLDPARLADLRKAAEERQALSREWAETKWTRDLRDRYNASDRAWNRLADPALVLALLDRLADAQRALVDADDDMKRIMEDTASAYLIDLATGPTDDQITMRSVYARANGMRVRHATAIRAAREAQP